VTAEARGEWQVERLDLAAYLERVAFGGAPRADAETLRALHRAHVTSIPFENLDIVLGRRISLELDDVQNKLVRRRRGGYCFEHALLFAAALERIGFSVTRLIARVIPDPPTPGPRTHMLSRVAIGGRQWLADVGFGAGVLEPLPLEADTAVDQEGWHYRLQRDGDAGWVLSAREGTRWSALHAFTLEPQRPIDYVVANHFTETHPRSPFVGRPIAFNHEVEFRRRLRGLELTIERPDAAGEQRLLSTHEREEALHELFGIELSSSELATLRHTTR
jgi:N-hydroxyarylamine O-acetyltransferase